MSLENTEWLNDLKDGFADVFRALSPKEQSQALRRAYLKEGNRLLKRARDVVNASQLGKGRKNPRKPRVALNTARTLMGGGLYRLLRRVRNVVNASQLGKGRKVPRKSRVALNTARTPMGDGLYRRVYPKGGGFMVSAKPYRRNTKKGMHRNLYGQLKPILNFAADGTDSRSTGRAKRSKGKGHSTGRMPKLFDLRAVEDGEARTVEGNIYTEFQRQCEAALRRKGLT